MKPLFSALLLTAGLAGTAATARAQATVTFGPRLGLNITTFSYSGTPQDADETKGVGGLQLGGTANIRFGAGNLAFQPSLVFTQKGAELRSAGAASQNGFPFTYELVAKPKVNYLELPLNFVYTFGGDEGFQLFAGPYVALGVGGKGTYKVTFNSTDPQFSFFNGSYPGTLNTDFGDKQNPNDSQPATSASSAPPITLTFRRFDAGLNAGVGYRFGPFQAQLGYGLGLTNFTPNDPDGNDTGSKSYHRSVQLTANYFFGAK